ncbi:hypothetical protein Pcinc_030554 [Petrolisthes cinctipes]|uniref:Uncharacterized protein n=1 Tax=Petrolisthes cinctipes TaxID=88211 RepID=A0AAE1EXW1_PETCI|nr:hypothetical protein Pcinc_030554 [Petrolisthes cinctipes]
MLEYYLLSVVGDADNRFGKVAAIETRVSKATAAPVTTTTTTATTQQNHQQGQQQQPQHQQQQQQQKQNSAQHQPCHKHKEAHRQRVVEGVAEEGSERGEEEVGNDEEWWAERVVRVLGGMGGGQYSDTWYRSHAHLLHGDGPLPHTWRLYIAALAVCRHEVGWLMRALLTDFRSAGGDLRWLTSLHHAPSKLYALAPINNILAHRPWLLLPHHIQQLTKGEDSWSLGELCQALCIMTHFHALSSFLHGSGLSIIPKKAKKNIDMNEERELGNPRKKEPDCLQTRPNCSEDIHSSSNNANHSCNTRTDSKTTTTAQGAGRLRAYAHLTINPSLTYEDFNGNNQSRIPSFSVHEYNWQDHGYAMCSRLLGEVGAFLDDRFTAALSTLALPSPTLPASPSSQQHSISPSSTRPLSSSSTHSLSSSTCSLPVSPACSPLNQQQQQQPQQQEQPSSVDHQANQVPDTIQQDKTPPKTSPVLAKALWNYVQWLLGIHHDDCDYSLLNKHLDPQVKAFVKAACCYPETLTDLATRPSTTPHLAEMSVVVMEARLQSELLYALRAIMLHQC